jgi:DNA adenine methylase
MRQKTGVRMTRIRPTFKVNGSKYYLSKWIIGQFPSDYEEYTYLEPYCGAASIILNKNRSKLEAINDLDKGVVQIFRALRNEPTEFMRRLNLVKCCHDTFERMLKKDREPASWLVEGDYLDDAVTEYCLRNMSKHGQKINFGWTEKTLEAGLETWKKHLSILPLVAERLSEVHIFNKPAISVINTFTSENTLVYCNPPELNGKNMAMSVADHEELARNLHNFLGKVVISGTPGTIYNKLYKGWTCKKRKSGNRTEVIWKNF